MVEVHNVINLTLLLCFLSGVGTGDHWPPNVHRGGLALRTLEGYDIIIIMPLSTKPVIQAHIKPIATA